MSSVIKPDQQAITIETTPSRILFRCTSQIAIVSTLGSLFTVSGGIVLLVMTVVMLGDDVSSSTMPLWQKIAGAIVVIVSACMLGVVCLWVGLKRCYRVLSLYRNGVSIERNTVTLSNKQVYQFDQFCNVAIVRKGNSESNVGNFEISLSLISDPQRKLVIIPSDVGMSSYPQSKAIADKVATVIGIPIELPEPED